MARGRDGGGGEVRRRRVPRDDAASQSFFFGSDKRRREREEPSRFKESASRGAPPDPLKPLTRRVLGDGGGLLRGDAQGGVLRVGRRVSHGGFGFGGRETTVCLPRDFETHGRQPRRRSHFSGAVRAAVLFKRDAGGLGRDQLCVLFETARSAHGRPERVSAERRLGRLFRRRGKETGGRDRGADAGERDAQVSRARRARGRSGEREALW
mmetsp:Transcript_7351/g.31336  ORF Transcript_7351/g.31336 Transcript_7351/m.31336 type:complete len:210 (+) Transcript_7351:2458-3087(+)